MQNKRLSQSIKNKHPLQYDAIVTTPFGAVGVAIQGVQVAIELLSTQHESKVPEHKLTTQVASQINAYFANAHNDFNLPLIYSGTPFQRRVWKAISAIPCGRVVTYGEIAQQIGSGARAVANACGANHLPLIIPCHRVVAKNGLGGFMQGNKDGIKIKKWLLKHEGVSIKSSQKTKTVKEKIAKKVVLA